MNRLCRISEIIGILLLTLAYPLKLVTEYHYYIFAMLGASMLFFATCSKTKTGKLKFIAGVINLGLCVFFILDECIKINTCIAICSLFILISIYSLVLYFKSNCYE